MSGYEKEDKKAIILNNTKSNLYETSTKKTTNNIQKSVVQYHQYNHQYNHQYISFEKIKEIFDLLSKLFCNEPTNKQFMTTIKLNKIDINKHDLEHFIRFCKHVSYKIRCYKSQDRYKLRGDYKTQVDKKDHASEITGSSYKTDSKQCKIIHTDSYNYIDSSLYETKYFTLYSFIKLFINSNGGCFYCNKPFDITLTDKYMNCKYKNCIFYTPRDRIKIDKMSMHDITKRMRWSLERINNTIGHYQNNCVLSCLGCNLKRRNENHQSFKFTKTLSLNKIE